MIGMESKVGVHLRFTNGTEAILLAGDRKLPS